MAKERQHRDGSCALCFRVWPMNLATAQLHTRNLFHPFVLRYSGNCNRRLHETPLSLEQKVYRIESRLGIEGPEYFPSRSEPMKKNRALQFYYPGKDLNESRDKNFMGDF